MDAQDIPMDESKDFYEELQKENSEHNFLTALVTVLSNGWVLFFGIIALLYFLKNFKKKTEKWRENADRHKNPDKYLEQEAAIAAARQRMQEKYSVLVQEQVEKEEEKKKNSKETDSQKKATDDKPKKPLKPIRPEYNPLMADTSSRSFGGRRRTGGG